MTGKKHYSILDDFGDSARQPSVIEPAETNEVAKPNDRVALSGEIGHRAVRLVITRDSSGSEKIEADFKGYESDEFFKVLNSARTITGSGGARAIERAGADELPTHSQDTQVSGLRRYRDSSTRGSGPDFVSDNTEFVPRPVQGTVVNGSRNYEDDVYDGTAYQPDYDQTFPYDDQSQSGVSHVLDELDQARDERRKPKNHLLRRLGLLTVAASMAVYVGTASPSYFEDDKSISESLHPANVMSRFASMKETALNIASTAGIIDDATDVPDSILGGK